jgi:hypothetical protein
VNGDAQQTDLVGNRAGVGIQSDAGHTGGDTPGLVRPHARPGSALEHRTELFPGDEELPAAEGVKANPRRRAGRAVLIVSGAAGGPDNRVGVAAVGHLDPHQEPHPVQPRNQRTGGAGLGVRPEGLAVINSVHNVLDVALR